jgi:hypothetical protein
MMTKPFGFGNGSITEKNWKDILDTMDDLRVSSVLEIGAGFSTILFSSTGRRIVSYESDIHLIKRLVDIGVGRRCEFAHCSYPKFANPGSSFDLAFVDGPWCPREAADGRLSSMKFAVAHSSGCVFIHDSQRTAERSSIETVFSPAIWTENILRDGMSLFVRAQEL